MIIGLTGGIATGKSTAAEYLAAKGAAVIDADQISHQLTQKGKIGWQLIKAEFGAKILKESKELNRKKLAEIVFSAPQKRKKLESILHPLIISKMKAEAEKHLKADKIVVFMAPLLYEANLDRFCDQVWVIASSREIQIERLQKRNNLNRDSALKRINSQMSLVEKKERADIIISNNSTIKDLREKIDFYWDKILEEKATKLS